MSAPRNPICTVETRLAISASIGRAPSSMSRYQSHTADAIIVTCIVQYAATLSNVSAYGAGACQNQRIAANTNAATIGESMSANAASRRADRTDIARAKAAAISGAAIIVIATCCEARAEKSATDSGQRGETS